MNIHHVLFFCFLSALCGGNTGLVSAKLNIYAGAKGGSGTINCHFSMSENRKFFLQKNFLIPVRKFFCKDECKAEDILIKTDDDSAQSGKYSTEYRKGSSGRGIVSVTITNLTKSDSGRYRCGLGRTLVPDSYCDFEVRVSDAPLPLDVNSHFIRTVTEGETFRYGCLDAVNRSRTFFCKDECKKKGDILVDTDENSAQSGRYIIEYIEGSVFGLYVSITKATKSDTGWYRCGYGRALSPDSYNTFPFFVIDASTPTTQSSSSSSVFLLPLVVCVFVVVVLSAVVLLLLHKLKTNRNPDDRNMECDTNENCPPVSTCDDSVYQGLDPASRDQDQTYSTLTPQHT